MSGLELLCVSSDHWPALAGGFSDLNFEQSGTYAEAAARRIGAKVQYYGVVRNGQVIAAAALRIKAIPGLGRGIAWIPSGPLIMPSNGRGPDPDSFVEILSALRAEMSDRRGHVLRLRMSGTTFLTPDTVASSARAAGFEHTDRAPLYHSYVISLKETDDSLIAGFHSKWRGHLRSAFKAGLSLDRGTGPKYQARFIALFDEVQKAKGFEQPSIRPEFHFSMQGTDYDYDILIATKDETDVGGIVIGGSLPACVYLFGATAEAGRQHRAGYFLTWHAFARAREMGFLWYDMGGVDTVTNPAVAEFKERTGGLPIQAEAFEAVPAGLTGKLILGLEHLRSRLVGKG
jgi:lipid II:glycine glycyltransferase (peptidoglycan interpeptide bridge formation enzyme)